MLQEFQGSSSPAFSAAPSAPCLPCWTHWQQSRGKTFAYSARELKRCRIKRQLLSINWCVRPLQCSSTSYTNIGLCIGRFFSHISIYTTSAITRDRHWYVNTELGIGHPQLFSVRSTAHCDFLRCGCFQCLTIVLASITNDLHIV